MTDSEEQLVGAPSVPVRLTGADSLQTSFIFSSPHSGRCYPEAFVEQADAPLSLLRRSEDAYIDQLFSHVPSFGACLIEALFPRAFVDPNRAPNELDPSMFVDAPLGLANPPGARAAAGLGVVPRLGADGRAIHARPIAFSEARARLDQYYHPYHAALHQQIERTRLMFGHAVVIDCHSMPAASARGADIVLGDRYGASCSRGLVSRAEAHFRSLGFAVVRNRPYAGGFTTEHYGNPASGVHVLQVEINRGLYLHERHVRLSSGAKGLKKALVEWTNRMILPANMLGFAAE